ncbi:tRNA 2-thiouridine(34) synthase MnmA [Nitrospira sp. NS4]|uniref:tRNA 2-thiouridine(34) synthase MnmA n=1 Tax=Nitrospira sp. NS4 TaxID=3414498 RepID=UPI003C2E95F3
MSRPSVLLGMSGGVDSSVAALLLVRQGYDVHGVTLQVWEHEDETVAASKRWQERGCCKVGIARYVAQKLNIPHELIDSREQFRAAVIEDFVSGYAAGTTPNPCVRCNERVKLRQLVEIAEAKGISFVATGHYARVETLEDRPVLKKGIDQRKDQSYFLYRLQASWLNRLLFPVGMMDKPSVWNLAEDLGLPSEELQESQEICFVSHGDYRTFLQKEIPSANNPGLFLDQTGKPLGTHQGIAFYTPGQRRGLGISSGERLYVQRVQPDSNTVVLGPDESLLSSHCVVADLNVLDPLLLAPSATVEAKVRYATPATPATIRYQDNGSVAVRFQTAQRALSPGQSAVFYHGDQLLGGGIIQSM